MVTINEIIRIFQRPKLDKRKLTGTKIKQNILKGPKLEKCQLTGTKIRIINLQEPKMKKKKNANLPKPKTYLSLCKAVISTAVLTASVLLHHIHYC